MAKRSFRYARYSLFFAVILAVIAAAWMIDKRKSGVLACEPAQSDVESYLAYCQISGFGDYDHGAFWFDFETGGDHARNADLLIIGNSRVPFAFSTAATSAWVSKNAVNHYVLGFTHVENVNFFRPLLRELNPDPRVVVINVDDFFTETVTVPAAQAFAEDGWQRYSMKRFESFVHRSICNSVVNVCGSAYAIYRTEPDGHWQTFGNPVAESSPVVYDVDPHDDPISAEQTDAATEFVRTLGIDKKCVIFTHIPSASTKYELAKKLAESIGVTFIAPKVDGLSMFDGSHLDGQSGQTWSEQFFKEANDELSNCLSQETPI